MLKREGTSDHPPQSHFTETEIKEKWTSQDYLFNWAWLTFILNWFISFCLVGWFWFWPHHTARGILFPRPGIEPEPSTVRVWSPHHWTSRGFPISSLKIEKKFTQTFVIMKNNHRLSCVSPLMVYDLLWFKEHHSMNQWVVASLLI